MKIFSHATIVEAEKKMVEAGTYRSLDLMNRLIDRIWRALRQSPEMRDWEPSHVVVYVGRGRNAGAAIGLASRFHARPITLCSVGELRSLCQEASTQLGRIPVGGYSQQTPEPEPGLLIIDALFDSEAGGDPEEKCFELARQLNKLRRESPRSLTVSLDVPMGLDPETGEVIEGKEAVQADVTLSIGAVRRGLARDAALDSVGRLLGVPLPELEKCLPPSPVGASKTSRHQVLDEEMARGWLRPRRRSTHKYEVGTVTVIAGSPGMVGAAQMCAEAALTAGAGLVTLYCPEEVHNILATRVAPEVMVRPLRKDMEAKDILPRQGHDDERGALVMGPGMSDDFLGGMKKAGMTNLYSVLKEVVELWPGCVVLDAGGLTTAFKDGWSLPDRSIFTPHLGEMRRIFSRAKALNSREEIVEEFLRTQVGTLVLKGGRTIISNGSERCVNSSGGPWMAGPGFGDILAGVIGALAAQGLSPMRAAALGVFACGQAATDAWRTAGFPPAVRATSTLAHLPGRLS